MINRGNRERNGTIDIIVYKFYLYRYVSFQHLYGD